MGCRRAGRRERRSAGAVVTADEDHVRVRLRDAAATVPTPDSLTSFNADARARVHVLQVEDERCEIFDGIDVVVGGGR